MQLLKNVIALLCSNIVAALVWPMFINISAFLHNITYCDIVDYNDCHTILNKVAMSGEILFNKIFDLQNNPSTTVWICMQLINFKIRFLVKKKKQYRLNAELTCSKNSKWHIKHTAGTIKVFCIESNCRFK